MSYLVNGRKVQMVNSYPANWAEISKRVKEEAGWKCVRCATPHSGRHAECLTVHHFDGNKANCRWWNLIPLCWQCHLSIQTRVNPYIAYLFEHAHWIKPYIAGFYAMKYLGQDLSREDVLARLDDLADMERVDYGEKPD